jgi:hypothetical protein
MNEASRFVCWSIVDGASTDPSATLLAAVWERDARVV